jgi:hypothetical protein
MPTLVYFSGRRGDLILVQSDVDETNDHLADSGRSASGFCELTQVPGQEQRFDPRKVFVNPDRVAYLKPAG